MMKNKITKLFHIHKWNLIKDRGITIYMECRCGKRTFKQRPGCYQPVDWNWIKGNEH